MTMRHNQSLEPSSGGMHNIVLMWPFSAHSAKLGTCEDEYDSDNETTLISDLCTG